MTASGQLGREGEAIAARHLEDAGWTVLERNYRAGRNEVDLIVRRGRTVAFVEVKSRRGTGFGHPLEAITERKRGEIAKVARAWLRARGGLRGLSLRFDAVAVQFGDRRDASRAPSIDHVADAWRL